MRTVASVRKVQYSASEEAQSASLINLKDWRELTSTVSRDAIYKFILTHLEQAAITRFANAVMGAVPWATHAVSDFPFLVAVAYCDDCTNNFVAGYAGEGRSFAKGALLKEGI
jgi:hypothetical protein